MNPKNVRAEFARAQKSLQAAKILQADGLFEDAVSRAYYAVMHSAKAALLVHDKISESHAAISATSARSWCGVAGSRKSGLQFWQESKIDALPPTMMRHFRSTPTHHCRLLKMLTASSKGYANI